VIELKILTDYLARIQRARIILQQPASTCFLADLSWLANISALYLRYDDEKLANNPWIY
jgi:hypothetical protein